MPTTKTALLQEEEEESEVEGVVLEGEEEGEDNDSESVGPPLNDDDSYAGGLYQDDRHQRVQLGAT